MKIAGLKNSFTSRFAFILLLGLFLLTNLSCGLEVYILMPEPISTITQKPDYSNTDDTGEKYFEFVTNESADEYESLGDFKFRGTEIYYRIYGSTSTLDTQVNTLVSYATDSTKSASSYDKLISYGYKALASSNYDDEPLIKASSDSTDQRVYIRLTDYYNQSEYSARITVDGDYLGGSSSVTVPLRNGSDGYTFNFGRSGTYDKAPLSGDSDVSYSSSANGNWYVAMFAVGLGRDTTFTSYHSNIEYLGSVYINANEENN
ncbi:MAG: hypothetical protein K5866_11250 [Treponema sp.]|nr:hypothetical protein [Treponema sp.]